MASGTELGGGRGTDVATRAAGASRAPVAARRGPGAARRVSAAALLLVATLPLTACTYLRDRALDATDVVDPTYAFGTRTMGLGVKLEVTEFLGLGLGYGDTEGLVRWRGRVRRADADVFRHFVLTGWDGPPSRPSYYLLGLNLLYYDPLHALWRIGARVQLPLAHVGVALNLGELLDLLAGLVALDVAGDDGLAWGAPAPAAPAERDAGKNADEAPVEVDPARDL